MYKKVILIIAFTLSPLLAYAETYWGGELPNVSDTTVNTEVAFDGDIYSYSYSVHSGSANSGQIWIFGIDIIQPQSGMALSDAGLVNGLGFARHGSAYVVSDPSTPKMVPIGLFSPTDWHSGLSRHGAASWGSNTEGDRIYSGHSLSGYKMTSHGLPGIREFKVVPDLIPPKVGTVTLDQIKATRTLASLFAKTIGPTAPPKGVDGNLDVRALMVMIEQYISQSGNYGWIMDSELEQSLLIKLNEIRQAIIQNDKDQAKVALYTFMQLLNQSNSTQRTNEAYGLLYYNAKYMRDFLINSTSPPEEEIHGFNVELTPLGTTTVPR